MKEIQCEECNTIYRNHPVITYGCPLCKAKGRAKAALARYQTLTNLEKKQYNAIGAR